MSLNRRSLFLGLALVVAIAGTFVFGYRAGSHARRIRRENQPVRPWMSVPFIAHTHHVPPEVLFQAIGVEPGQHDRRPVRAIARAQNRPVADVIRDLDNAIAKARGMTPGKAP
jgi:hypothetical protein